MAATAEYPAAAIPGAAIRFPETEYATFSNVPVFREHQTTAVDGRKLQFGMQQLQMVADRCNRRIAETGDYAAIVIGHTPDPSDENGQQPELVGYAGPFRLGTIGEGDRKCWAILADFHIIRGDLAKVRKHPRRSPELCLEDSYEEMFLDPIALLGAEAPRLDLGLITGAEGGDGASTPTPENTARRLYSFVHNGRRVEKYAMAACAAPAAGNVFTPSDKIVPKRQDYAAQTNPPSPKPGATTMLTPEDISAVVEAFLATDAGQFLVQEMAEKKGTNAIVEPNQEPPADALAPEGAPEAAGPETPGTGEIPPPVAPAPEGEPGPGIGSAPPPEADLDTLPPTHAEPDGDEDEFGNEPEKAKKYAAACESVDAMDDKHLEKYLSKRWANHAKWKKYAAECGTIDGEEAPKPPAGEILASDPDPASATTPPAKKLADSGTEPAVAKPTQFYSRLQGELQTVKGQLAAEQAARCRVERYSRLQGLSAEFIMDPDDEMEMTADMDDRQFQRHVDKTIREHYQRNPVGLPWASPPDAMSTGRDQSHPGNQPKETTERDGQKAIERYQRKKAAGESCDFAEILEEVKAGR